MRSDGETPQRAPALGGFLLLAGILITAAGLAALNGRLLPGADALGSESVSESELVASDARRPLPSPLSIPDASTSAGEEQAPTPVGIRIPAIDVAADMIALGLRDDGTIDVPSDYAQTGWWADGPEPGEQGPAVVLGHVDSRSGPAVFFSLTELQPGDEIVIDRVDGSSVAYRVDRIEQHAKDEFPTEAVYGDTDDPQLRLVTCGGDFDRSVRSYDDNVVVFATRA